MIERSVAFMIYERLSLLAELKACTLQESARILYTSQLENATPVKQCHKDFGLQIMTIKMIVMILVDVIV